MRKGLILLTGLGLGAGLMYMLDPDRGKRRRAYARDKFDRLRHRAEHAVGKTKRHTMNRIHGVIAGLKAFSRHEAPSDDVLAERVRSRMGRAVARPHAIEIKAARGRVTLRGRITANEADALLKCVSMVPGVAGVDNKLEVFAWSDEAPVVEQEKARAATM
ncbi:MAG TPA: BON domain-containing protein [Blastocatellia bacterium]|nr:BON domain-containing protein [Blastocatellia bacterium]